ncbi:MAG: nucleoside triphosphate pyrophosphohydrolase family protein [Saprospiraceae bacterium]
MKFEEPQDLNGVAKFHQLFRLPIVENPKIPGKDRIDLRLSLIEEELNELKTAISENDLVEVADAFADLQYVLSGAILEFGLGPKFKAIFDEVQRSNMSKLCKSLDEAEKTKEYYLRERGVESYIEKVDDEYQVSRVGDGKVLKSINYSPPEIESILNS